MKLPAIIVASLALAASAQPPNPPPPRDGPPARDMDPAAFRARLERMLEDSKQRQEQIQAALKQLDAGASTEQVQRGLDEGSRFRGRGGMRGGHRDGGP